MFFLTGLAILAQGTVQVTPPADVLAPPPPAELRKALDATPRCALDHAVDKPVSPPPRKKDGGSGADTSEALKQQANDAFRALKATAERYPQLQCGRK